MARIVRTFIQPQCSQLQRGTAAHNRRRGRIDERESFLARILGADEHHLAAVRDRDLLGLIDLCEAGVHHAGVSGHDIGVFTFKRTIDVNDVRQTDAGLR